MNRTRVYSIVNDPLYYAVVAFFALVATALPAALGQRWLLPVGQTITLFLLSFVAWRQGSARHALRVLSLWVLVQGACIFVVVWLTGADSAFPNGFAFREALLEWVFGVGALPNTFASAPLARAVETLGVTLLTTLSAGLLGVWYLVNTVNLYVFGLATAWTATGSVWGLVAAAQPWWLLRIAAYVALVACFALPGYTGKWLPAQWLPEERRILYWALGLLALALALEVVLPGVWAAFASGRIASPAQ